MPPENPDSEPQPLTQPQQSSVPNPAQNSSTQTQIPPIDTSTSIVHPANSNTLIEPQFKTPKKSWFNMKIIVICLFTIILLAGVIISIFFFWKSNNSKNVQANKPNVDTKLNSSDQSNQVGNLAVPLKTENNSIFAMMTYFENSIEKRSILQINLDGSGGGRCLE